MSKYHQKNRSSQRSFQGGIEEQLTGARSALGLQPSRNIRPLRASAAMWKKDGEDHINIHFKGLTDLGRQLEFNYRLPFRHNIFLNFNTVAGFQAYISSIEQPEILRSAIPAPRLKDFIETSLTMNSNVKHLRAMVMDAAYQRILSNPDLKQMFYENELPFDIYRTEATGVRVRPKDTEWIVEGYAEIQKAIHSQTEPTFFSLCDDPWNPPVDIYESVRPELPVAAPQYTSVRKDKTSRPVKSEKKNSGSTVRPEQRWREYYSVKPESGYSPALPILTEDTETLIHKSFRREGQIASFKFQTGPLVTDVNQPLIGLSNHPKLAELGLISDEDVLRCGPIDANSFMKDTVINSLLKLQSVVANDGNEMFIIPVGMKIMNSNHDNPDDVQKISVNGNRWTIQREVVFSKPLNVIQRDDGTEATWLDKLKELVVDTPEPETFKYAVMKLVASIVLDLSDRTVNLVGSVFAKGISTHATPAIEQVSKYFQTEGIEYADTLPHFEIEGYSVQVFRGKIKENKTEIEETPVSQMDEVTAEIGAYLNAADSSSVVSDNDPMDEAVEVPDSPKETVQTESETV